MNEKLNFIDTRKSHAFFSFKQSMEEILRADLDESYSEIIVLCIGTDRSTGDSLGPLIGHKLKNIENAKIKVYGTLAEPVHAKNLNEVVKKIENKYDNPFIIAIDACLGSPEKVGCICVGRGPIRPGAGVNKELCETGHIHIIGVVNVGGFMEYIILQNTRLALVFRMADIISASIYHNLLKFTQVELNVSRGYEEHCDSKI